MLEKKGLKRIVGYALLFFVFLLVDITSFANSTGYITAESTKIYSIASEDSDVVGNIIKGTQVSILDEETDGNENEWCYIYTSIGTIGYIPSWTVEYKIETQKYVEATNSLNIRELPSTEAKKIGAFKEGETAMVLNIIENDNNEQWYQIAYEDIVGYVKGTSVKEVEIDETTEASKESDADNKNENNEEKNEENQNKSIVNNDNRNSSITNRITNKSQSTNLTNSKKDNSISSNSKLENLSMTKLTVIKGIIIIIGIGLLIVMLVKMRKV